ncbi:hypothetical protein Tco_0937851, partial [Tanacetum coccineum]
VVWALAAFPTPTANVPSAERLAVTIVRAATAHFSLRHGAVAGNAAEPSGSDVFGVFYSTFMFLVLCYLQCKVGSFGFSGLAHAIYLSLLYLEEVKPHRHILFATVLLVTIVFKSGDHPYKILDNFVELLTMWYIFVPTILLAEMIFEMIGLSPVADPGAKLRWFLSDAIRLKGYLKIEVKVKMDNPNITMEEYIRLEEEKARRRGKVYNWETATYGKIWDNEDVHDLGSDETEFSAIDF